MNIPMTRTIAILYPNLAKTMMEGTYKSINEAGQTYNTVLVRGELKTINEVKKGKLFALLDGNKGLADVSELILAEMIGVSKTTINRWKGEYKK